MPGGIRIEELENKNRDDKGISLDELFVCRPTGHGCNKKKKEELEF